MHATCAHIDAGEKKLRPLPTEYTDIKPTMLSKTITIKQPSCLNEIPLETCTIPDNGDVNHNSEEEWLEYVQECIENQQQDQLDISWAGFHAYRTENVNTIPNSTALLPLFREVSKSPAMIKHALDVIWRAVNFLNKGQLIVVALDQPLYALAKRIQWEWPDQYGIHKFVIMLGGLHTEMSFLSALGDWLDASGWVTSLSNASIATTGVAESFLSGNKVSKSRYAHEVTVCVLDILMRRAYNDDNSSEEFIVWRAKKEKQYPQFKFWSLTKELELLLLRFVRSFRASDFDLYIKCLDEMLPWFFALDHGNYARWLPVHLQDMKSLHLTNPAIHTAFKAGGFVISKTVRKFSDIPIDQAHEQNNKLVKGDGGAIGLTENSAELTRWMVSGPEISRVVHEFQANLSTTKGSKADTKHHEQTRSFQDRFRKHIASLLEEIEALDNPFLETSNELIALDTKDIAERVVCETVISIESLGKEKYSQYQQDRLVSRAKPLDDTIHRSKLPLFNYAPKLKSRNTTEIASLRNNVLSFFHSYI